MRRALVLPRALLALAALGAAVAVTACRFAEVSYETVVEPLRKNADSVSCTGGFARPDLAALEACGDGKGHCYEGSHVPIADLPACSGSRLCVPDAILSSHGGKLEACKFFIGDAPGACLSILVKDVAAHADQLQRDTCAADERCVPCVNPTDGKPTKVCDSIGVYEGACSQGAGARAPTCCHGAGSCLRREGVPEDSRGDLSIDICPVDMLCAPAAMVSGEPKKCTLYGAPGVCLDVCFARTLSPAARVARSYCGPTEVCMPCFLGAGQGMPGCD